MDPARFLDHPPRNEDKPLWAKWLIFIRLTGLLVGFWILALCVMGLLRGGKISLLPQGVPLALLVLFLCLRLIEQWNGHSNDVPIEKKPGKYLLFREAELGTLLLAAVYVLAETSGGAESPLFPLVYLLLFLLGGYTSWQCGVYLAILASAIELGTYGIYETKPFSPVYLTTRIVLVWISGFLYRLLLRGDADRKRYQFQRKVENHLEEIHRDAHIFRLDASDQDASEKSTLIQEQEQRTIASVRTVRLSLENLLQMSSLTFSPPLYSLLLFILNDEYFTLRMAISSSQSIVKGPIPRGRGILGRVEDQCEPVFLQDPSHKRTEIPYYRYSETISRVAAFPILWEGKLMGALVADRREKVSFSEDEKNSLASLSREIVRVMEFERLFMDLQKKKHAFEKFHQVAHEFNRTRHVEDVAQTATVAVQDISGAPFSALTIREPATQEDFIIAAKWNDQDVDHLCGRKLLPDGGLVSQAIKRGCPLPENTALNPQQILFDPSIPTIELTGAKVFPLISGNRVLGTLVVGDTSSNFLSGDAQRMTGVIADHAALALAQANLNEKIERMATTDGLTGLVNHRYFQIKLEEAFHRAQRYRKQVSLLILDIDHFKTINDTRGHPFGDRVLRTLAEMLFQMSRQTDVVARYGGEEFAIIMEETGPEGAALAAERIREKVANHAFESIEGALRCSVSIGVASCPEHTRDKTSILALADQALYRAKNIGRNRVVVYGEGNSSGADACEPSPSGDSKKRGNA